MKKAFICIDYTNDFASRERGINLRRTRETD